MLVRKFKHKIYFILALFTVLEQIILLKKKKSAEIIYKPQKKLVAVFIAFHLEANSFLNNIAIFLSN